MKKFASIAVGTIVLLSGCFDKRNIGLVKSGTMEFDKSLKIGDAFENWGECTDKKWTQIKTSQGREVVQFECKSIKIRDFVQYGKTNFPNLFPADFKDMSETVSTFQWTVNTDDTFELTSATRIYKWADGAIYDGSDGASNHRRLQIVYKNVIEFDVNKLQGPSGKQYAQIQRENIEMIRRFGAKVAGPTEPPTQSIPSQATVTVSRPENSNSANKLLSNGDRWTMLQNDPNAYLAQCTNELKAVYARAGNVTIAMENDAREVCTATINVINQCMKKPDAKVDGCFEEAENTGD